MYIRKKTFILIITYLAAAVVALGAYTAVHFGMEGSYRRTAEYSYAHAFEEVVGSVSALSDSLHRASYASGAELSGQLCADIYGSCLAAEMTMAVLPFSTQELEQTAAFIGIAGDYARGSLRTSAQSGFDDAARRNFASLYKTAAALTRELSELRNVLKRDAACYRHGVGEVSRSEAHPGGDALGKVVYRNGRDEQKRVPACLVIAVCHAHASGKPRADDVYAA